MRTTDLELVVTARDRHSAGVVGLTLSSPDAADLPPWEPGAHIDVRCGDVVRQYSLCGDRAARSSYHIAVLREAEGRGGSAYLHDEVRLGDRLTVSAPRNNFALVEAERYVFIAGGIGITPIVPMLAEATALGKPWTLAYGGRSRSTMAFQRELAEMGPQVSVLPEDESGLLDLEALLAEPQSGTKIYCCGPAALLNATEKAAAHWPPGSLHIERFVPKALEVSTDREFEVRLARAGTSHRIPPGTSIIDVLADAGVGVPSSCGVGTCGTCESVVLEGVPEHRDSILNDEERAEGTYMMICVSRASSPALVLDI
ncbi:MAG: PDR/VanB family oxidoreductase [Marmoricola sp.]|jgi:ferredoxin-NADP reductase